MRSVALEDVVMHMRVRSGNLGLCCAKAVLRFPCTMLVPLTPTPSPHPNPHASMPPYLPPHRCGA